MIIIRGEEEREKMNFVFLVFWIPFFRTDSTTPLSLIHNDETTSSKPDQQHYRSQHCIKTLLSNKKSKSTFKKNDSKKEKKIIVPTIAHGME